MTPGAVALRMLVAAFVLVAAACGGAASAPDDIAATNQGAEVDQGAEADRITSSAPETVPTPQNVESTEASAVSESVGDDSSGADPVRAVGAEPDLARGLVAHYELDGDATDALGASNGEATELVGAPDRHGVGGAATQFGVGSFIEVQNPEALNVERDFSIAAWVDIGDLGGDWYTIFEKSDPERGGHSRYGFWLHGRNPAVCFEAADNSRQPCLEADVEVPLDGWHHVAAVRDAREFRLYLNGEQVASGFAGLWPVSQSPFNAFIGTDTYQPGAPWLDAIVDDVRVYDRPLLDAEVAALAT